MNRLKEGIWHDSPELVEEMYDDVLGCREYAKVIKKEDKINIQRTEVGK